MKKILFTLALLISFSSFGQTSAQYFKSGFDKFEAKDYYGAIADYTKAIELIYKTENSKQLYILQS